MRAIFETRFLWAGEADSSSSAGNAAAAERDDSEYFVDRRICIPGVGYYNATKFAVEGLTEALAKECEPLGIRAMIVVEPGPFRTDWAGRSLEVPQHPMRTTQPRPERVAWPSRAAAASRRAIRFADAGDDPSGGVGRAPMRLVLGRMALETAQAELEQVRSDLEGWKETTLSADYPREPGERGAVGLFRLTLSRQRPTAGGKTPPERRRPEPACSSTRLRKNSFGRPPGAKAATHERFAFFRKL